jgi:hypothetical protein
LSTYIQLNDAKYSNNIYWPFDIWSTSMYNEISPAMSAIKAALLLTTSLVLALAFSHQLRNKKRSAVTRMTTLGAGAEDPAMIFWDLENLPVKKESVAFFIKALMKKYGRCRIFGFGNMRNQTSDALLTLHSHGVDLLYVPRGHSKIKEATDRAITRKMSEVSEDVAPTVLVIITNDGDFVCDIAKAKQRGHFVDVIYGASPSRLIVSSQADERIAISEFLPPPPQPTQCSTSLKLTPKAPTKKATIKCKICRCHCKTTKALDQHTMMKHRPKLTTIHE